LIAKGTGQGGDALAFFFAAGVDHAYIAAVQHKMGVK
jgi:hypothetical protein